MTSVLHAAADGAAARERVNVSYVSLGLPARRFAVKATIGYDARVPLLTEFSVRLLRIAGDIPVSRMATYFGLSGRECEVLLDELQSAGLIEFSGENVRLSRKGRALFIEDDKDPRIAIVEEFNQNVAFERATMSPLGRVPYDAVPPKSVVKVPIKDRARAASASASIREAFRKNIAEIGATYLDKRVNYDRAYVYSVDEVIAKRAFTYEIELPIELSIAGVPSVKVNYQSLERGRYGSRDELLQVVSGIISSAFRGPAQREEEDLDFVARFDRGLLSKTRSADLASSDVLKRYMTVPEEAGDRIEATVVFLGSVTTDEVSKMLLSRTKASRFGSESTSDLVYWVSPRVPLWGRSSRFEALMSVLRSGWGKQVEPILISSSDADDAKPSDIKYWFGGTEKGGALFSYGAVRRSTSIGGDVEFILRPNRWVVALSHFRFPGSDLRLPVGLYSEDSSIVSDAAAALRDQLAPLSRSCDVIWHPNAVSKDDAIAFIEAGML